MKKTTLLVAVSAISLVILATFSNISNAAMLTYSFDDGHISVYSEAFSILENYGQVGTANVISNTVKWADSGETTRVNSAQLREMQDAGWEICSHSKSHPRFSQIPQTYNEEILGGWASVSGTDYTYKANYAYEQLPFLMENGNTLRRKVSINEVENLPGSYYFDASINQVFVHTTDSSSPSNHEMRADSVQRELEMSKSELTEMGLDIQNFIVPYSDWSEDRRELAMEYYNSVGAGYHDGWVNDIPPADIYWLVRKSIRNTTTVDEVQSWVENAIEDDQWLILMLHIIGEGESSLYWPEEKLDTFAAWMSTQDILVVTQQQGLDSVAVPIPPTWILFLSGAGILGMIRARKKSIGC
jgi:peptidoglycan/xylan/chitin deacetylase (PgdA/CDA1 family)